MKVNTQQAIGLALIVAIMVSALTLVSVRHLNRLSFYQLQKLERQRDDLSIEWRQLMAEYSTWRREHSIEAEVRGDYKMEPPSSQRIELIHLASRAKGVGLDQ